MPSPALATTPDETPADSPRGLPGATVRHLKRGALAFNVYRRDGQDWLSTSTVLRLMRYGEMPPPKEECDPPSLGAPAAAIEYGRMRGSIVGDACQLWVEAGCPDPAVFGYEIDKQLAEWKAAQAKNWQRFTVVPYLTALAAYCVAEQLTLTYTEVLVEDEGTHTFGYADARTADGWTVEIKTSARLYRSHILQAASYARRASVVRLDKTGVYEAHDIMPEDGEHFAWLAQSAHELVAEWET